MEKLRFKDDNGNDYPEWEETRLKKLLINNSLKNKNQQILEVKSVSNKYGFTNPDLLFDRTVASKNLKNYTIISENCFAYNPSRINVGSIALNKINEKFVISPLYVSFKVSEKLNQNYFLKYFETVNFKNNLNSSLQGSVRQSLSFNSLGTFKYSLPCLEEQNKIANYFENLDIVINETRKEIDHIEKYKKDMLYKIFNQKIRFKDDNGNEYPEWKEDKVGNLFKVTRGEVIAKTKISPIINKNFNIPVYSSQTKNEGIMGYYNEKLFSNSIIWTTDGANAGTVRFVQGDFYCSNVCGVLLSNKYEVNNCFSELINLHTKRNITESVIPKFMNHAMSGLKIKYPSSIEEQNKISVLFSGIDSEILNLKNSLKSLNNLKKDMLEKMF